MVRELKSALERAGKFEELASSHPWVDETKIKLVAGVIVDTVGESETLTALLNSVTEFSEQLNMRQLHPIELTNPVQ